MDWLAISAGVLLVLAGGASGCLLLLHKAGQLRQVEQRYGFKVPHLRYLAGGIGLFTGLACGGLAVFFLSLNEQGTPILWIGRSAYLLIVGASGGHLFNLVYFGLALRREERAWMAEPSGGTLGFLRLRELGHFRRTFAQYADLKQRDERLLEELTLALGGALLEARRSLTRLPFYGYLGTICGILLMAQELSRIDEASQTFKILSSMAGGLVLAFQTTLMALIAYLPLRKAADILWRRFGELEEEWIRARDAEARP
ncbi:MAG: hypothetical protein GKR89_37680 [Candidatus Latescibacteria bacterium]|nr:hypothetical protein [Candidatus Latescibacterota bacterium]